MDEEMLETILNQNDIIIRLLARIAFSGDEVLEIVTKKKSDPQRYVEGYNALDGTTSLTDVAKVVRVTPGTLSPILRSWEEKGIVHQVEKSGRKFYKKLFTIK